MPAATVLGSIGVSLLLLAFLLSQIRFIRPDGVPYLLLNFTGAAIACYSSILIDFMPFVVLEGAWALVAAYGIIRQRQSGSS